MNNTNIISRVFKLQLNTRNIVKLAMLSAASFALMLLSFPLAVLIPIFPPELKIDISDLPALLGGFALGPVAGVIIELVKNILNVLVKGTDTGAVGELSNFIVGSAYIIPASLIYLYNRSRKGAIMGMLAGILSMSTIACFSNYYLILPLYGMKSNWGFIMTAILPFNLIKSTLLSIVTLLVYKKLSSVLHK